MATVDQLASAGEDRAAKALIHRGDHARATRWSRHAADLAAAVAVVSVAALRCVMLAARHEPTGVDLGNWLMLGHAALGSPLPQAPAVVYPPLVPLAAVALTNLFGLVWGGALLMGLAGVAPGAGLYVATRLNGQRWAAVAPSLLVMATSSTGEAVAWGGAPQLFGFGFAAVALGCEVRLLEKRSLRGSTALAVSLFAVAATSHLVLAQAVLALVCVLGAHGLARSSPIFQRDSWAGRSGWLASVGIVALPMLLLVPLYLRLASTVGQSFTQSSSTGPGLPSAAAFVRNLVVVYRDAPWFWRVALLGAAVLPAALWPARRRHREAWVLSVGVTCSLAIQAFVSGQERLVYLAPIAVGFTLILVGDVLNLGKTRLPASYDGDSRRVRGVVASVLATATVAASITGLAYFPRQRDFYGRLSPSGTTAGLDWIRDNTPSEAETLVAPIDGAPFGWWVQGYGRRTAYVATEDRWLNFPDERRRANTAVAVLSTQDLFSPQVSRRLRDLHVDYLVLPAAWGGVSPNVLTALAKSTPSAVVYSGRAMTIVKVSALSE